jgi:hypothetical protein
MSKGAYQADSMLPYNQVSPIGVLAPSNPASAGTPFELNRLK